MNKVSTIFRVFSIALAASTFSFASVGMADGATKFLGNTTTFGEIPDDFGTYWNQITVENECNWGQVEKERGTYNWSGCDLGYNWAKTNNAYFTFHTLLWGSQNPQWLYKLNVDETKKAWTDWIDAVKEHYPDLEMIEVVNEAVKSGNNYHSSFTSSKLVEALGGDDGDYKFVVTAFKMARERWPHAILIYNDYNTILWQVKEGIDLIKKIKAQGAPVDAYQIIFAPLVQGSGPEAQCFSSERVLSGIQEIYDKIKLPLFITEYSVGTSNDSLQKACYSEHIPLFMESEYIAGVALNESNPGLIKDGVERPALTWLKEYFNEHFYDSKNMWYEKGIERLPLDSLDSIALEQPIAIGDNGGRFGGKIRLEQKTLQNYDVFDMQGVRLSNLSAYGFNDANNKLKSASTEKTSGIYFLLSRTTGKMRSIRVAR